MARQGLVQYGLPPEMADLFLRGNQEWTYRGDFGRGEPVSEAELRQMVASGQVLNRMTAESVRVIESFRHRPVMQAATQTDAQSFVNSVTGTIDDYLSGQSNRFATGVVRGVGQLSAIGAGVQRTVNDAARAVLPDAVDNFLDEQDERNRQLVEAMIGAQSQVDRDHAATLRLAARHGIEIPLIARIANSAPSVVGEVAPSAVVYAPLIAATGGMGAPAAIAFNVGLGGTTAGLAARGRGADVETSAQAAVVGALQGGLVPLAGRYGVTTGVVTDLAATYAIGRAQGLSDQEIERTMLAALAQQGAFQVGRLRSGREAASLTRDVRSVVEIVRQSPANEAASRVYRVQGGTPPRASQDRITIGERGEMQVIGNDMLFITFDDAGRARD